MQIILKWMRLFILTIFIIKVSHARTRIIGGVPAVPHSAKHIVHLDTPSSLFCGGSLIDTEWVLSAAHCYMPPSNFHVVLGDYDLESDEGTEQVVLPSLVIPHPRYNTHTDDNDVMLIKLSEPAILNEYVQTIQLPPSLREPTVGTICSICGWGNIQAVGNIYPSIMRCADKPVVDTSLCNSDESYAGMITDSMFCIGSKSGGEDSCDGDSGSSATCDGVLEGVVSWGYGCAYPNFPGVYAKVSMFVDWIKVTQTYN